MSPRPAPTRHDATALVFLNTGAQLIDTMLAAEDTAARLKHLHYPVALEWIRIEDVLRIIAAERGGDASKAFRNRWAHRDDFLRDCFVHALLYRDGTGGPLRNADELGAFLANGAPPLPERIRPVIDSIMAQLVAHPRSYLLAHAAPMVARDPLIQEAVAQAVHADQSAWVARYAATLEALGCGLRPGWTLERLGAALQALIDGATVRHRLGVPLLSGEAWADASVAAEAGLALFAAVVDLDQDGLSVDDWVIRRMGSLRE